MEITREIVPAAPFDVWVPNFSCEGWQVLSVLAAVVVVVDVGRVARVVVVVDPACVSARVVVVDDVDGDDEQEASAIEAAAAPAVSTTMRHRASAITTRSPRA